MLLDLDTGRLVVFLAGLTGFVALESLFQHRRHSGYMSWRCLFHLMIAAFNTLLMRAVVFVPLLLWLVYCEEEGWGLSRLFGLGGWQEVVISLIVLDALDYWWHRWNHRVPFLWRFHKAHHADTEIDVSTALRFHPGELLISGLVKASWIALWGPSAIAWFVFEAAISLSAQWHHANIDLPDAVESKLRRLIVTPRFHAMHHMVDREFGDAHFSTIFSLWDPIFGSMARGQTRSSMKTVEIGLPEGRTLAASPKEWLLEPVRSRNLALARDSRFGG